MPTNLIDASTKRPGTSTSRTDGDRLKDTYNVRDFGADGTNDSPAIQAAINEAISRGGGTIYFPSGGYDINARLVVPGSSSAALTFLGDGGINGAASGSILNTSLTDYILYIGHRGSASTPTTPVKLIQGIVFHNGHIGGTSTSTEPPISPDGTSGDGMGCLYIGNPSPISIISCEFGFGGGLGVFSAADQLTMQGCNFIGDYNGGYPSAYSMGLIARSVHMLAGKIHAAGTCIELIHGISMIENMNLEVSGIGVNIGQNQLAYWEPAAASGAGQVVAANDTTFAPVPGGFANLQFESCGISMVRMINVTNFILQAYCQSFSVGTVYPTHGMYCESIRRCRIQASVSGGYTVAGIALGQGGAKGGGNLIEYSSVGPNSQNPTGLWILPTASHYNAGDDPYVFKNCDIDGGVTKANLPFPASAGGGTVYVVVTNSDLAAFSGTSNVGRIITTAGPASNRVLARWNSQIGDYVIAG